MSVEGWLFTGLILWFLRHTIFMSVCEVLESKNKRLLARVLCDLFDFALTLWMFAVAYMAYQNI
jgi:hypothetical protein